jgi:nickel/cobalt transporter (NicO) family protein
MLLLTMIFVAGVLHGLGPDHLAAITAFGTVVGHDFRRVTFFALRFAGGHAVVVAVAALLAHFGRLAMPARWERGFDLAAAGLLVLTGLAMLVGLITGHLSVHAHGHQHGGRQHEHFHAHLGCRGEHDHGHGKLAFVVGGLFALGGVRSLLVIVPAALADTVLLSLLRIAAFAAGILASMSAYGVLAGGALQRVGGVSDRPQQQRLILHLTTGAVGIFCIVAGLITLGERWHT